MLERVDVGTQSIDRYRASAGREAIALLRELAAPLKGCRVLHVSATPFGGGVAEILRSEIPLLRDLGVGADWQLISGNESFFRVTKTIHNGLQGSAVGLSADDEERYLAQSERNAKALDQHYDLVVVHDPQPLALLEFHGANQSRWIWRCHVDTSEPNASVWRFLQPFLVRYDAAVFTLGSFIPPDFSLTRTEVIPPAIDPRARRTCSWAASRPRVARVDRRRHEAAADRPDLAVRRMEGSARRGRRVPTGARAVPRRAARAGRFHGARRSRGWRVYRRIQRGSKPTPTSTCSPT